MVQIMPTTPSFGERLSSALGQGALAGFQQGYQQQQQVPGLMELAGLTKEQAQTIAGLDPKIIQQYMHQKLMEPQNRAFAQALGLSVGPSVQPQNMGAAPQQSLTTQQYTAPNAPSPSVFLPEKGKKGKKGAAPQPIEVPELPPEEGTPTSALKTLAPAAQAQPQAGGLVGRLSGGLNPQQMFQLAQFQQQERQFQQKQAAEREREERKENVRHEEKTERQIREANKETKEYHSGVLEAENGAKDVSQELNRLMTLLDKGDINPGFRTQLVAAAKEGITAGVGIPGITHSVFFHLPAWNLGTQLTPDETEATKITAKLAFGVMKMMNFARGGTNIELMASQDQVASILQGVPGAKQVARNLLKKAEKAQEEAKIMRKIIKANGNNRPFNLQDEVTEKMQPYLEKFQEEYANLPVGTSEQRAPTLADVLGQKLPVQNLLSKAKSGLLSVPGSVLSSLVSD